MLKSKKILAIILALALLVVSTVITTATQADDTASTLKAAFAAYVEKNGNNIVYGDVVAGVAAELEALGSTLTADDITLAEGDFYIKHAVDGVIDEDPDPTTRVNIPGSDGAAAAIFTVGGERISAVKAIPHTVENLGVLTPAKLDNNGTTIHAITVQGTGNNKIIIDGGLMMNNSVCIYGDASKLVALVSVDHADDMSVGAFQNIYDNSWDKKDTNILKKGMRVLQFSDDIKSISAAWTYESRFDNVKYIHIPENLTSMSYGVLNVFPSLENVNIPMGWNTDGYYPDHFLKNCPKLLEVYAPVAKKGTNSSFTGGPANRNFVVKGAEMSFAQAAAYAASNANAYEFDNTYTEESIVTAILDKVVCSGMTTSWDNSGILTLTSGTDTFDISVSIVKEDVNYNVEDIKVAFKNYVNEKGNEITYSNLVAGVAAELAEMGSSYVAADLGLAQADFYIKHAVDGVIDEDPDPTTRLNIEGSDGAVAAIFTVDGERLAMVETIPHTVENLGLLTVAKTDGSPIHSITINGKGENNKLVITDNKQFNNTVKIYGDYTKLVAIVATDYADSGTVMVGQNLLDGSTGTAVPVFGSVKAMSLKGVKTIDKRWSWNCFPELKYLEFGEGYTKSTGDNCFKGFSKLENLKLPSTFTSFGSVSFDGASSLLEVYSPVAADGGINSGAPAGRNFVVAGAEMSFAQAVAYAASNASTYAYDANYTEASVTTALMDKVVCTGMTTSWNDTLKFDTDTLMLKGTFTLTKGTDSFDVALNVLNENFEIATEDLKAAFDAYVTANGNDVTYDNILAGIKAELSKNGISVPSNYITLDKADFYIKHAVDGCIDEDPNPETRINIPGSDGAVSAIFVVDGVRVPMVKSIPHTVENLGVLSLATVNYFESNGQKYSHDISLSGTGPNKAVFDGVTFNNYLTVYGDYTQLVAMVFINQPLHDNQTGGNLNDQNGSNGQVFANVKAMQFENIETTFTHNWAWNCFPGVKYLRFPDKANFTWETFRNFYALENVNIPATDYYQDHFLRTATSLLEVYGPIAPVNNNSFKEGNPNRNFVVWGAEMSFAQAMAYAQANASEFEYKMGMTADEIVAEILGGRLVYSAGLTTDWNDTYNYDKEALTVSGTLTISDAKGNTMDIEFFRNFGEEMDVPAMNYVAFDTTDSALAIEVDDIDGVTEIGVEVVVGDKTYTYSTDYINAAAKNNKAFIALADKVYYCDVDMNGVVDGDDLITIKKNLLLGEASNATANLVADENVDILDFIKLKKVMAAEELEFSSVPFTNYTYAFAIEAELTEDVVIKPYCVKHDIKFYGAESSLAQFSTDWTVLVKP